MQEILGFLCVIVPIILVLVVSILIGNLLKSRRWNKRRTNFFINQNRGETRVRKTILAYFKPPNFHLLNNITLPIGDGTTQIDHILVSTKGVFVIETKHYSGWIFADRKSKQWMQTLYKVKNRFQNPIHQNYKHLKTVQELLEFLPEDQIHSIVVFTGNAQFKTPIPSGVVYLSQLVKFLRDFQDDVISFNRLQFCVGRLECTRYAISKSTDVHHNAYLAKKFDNN